MIKKEWLFGFLLLIPVFGLAQTSPPSVEYNEGDCAVIEVTWDHPTKREDGNDFIWETELSTYEVEISVDNFNTIQSIDVGVSNWTHYTPSCDSVERTYQIRVLAIDNDGNVSNPSDVATLAYNGEPITIDFGSLVAAPTNVVAQVIQGSAALPMCSDDTRYRCKRTITITDVTVIETN